MNLDRTICPGCGAENPASNYPAFFSCQKCEYEIDDGLPELCEMLRGRSARSKSIWNDVRLDLFLKTLLKP